MAITKSECKDMRAQVAKALEVLKSAGYDAKIMPRGSFDETKLTLKIEVSKAGVNTEAADFRKYAEMFDMKPEDYGSVSTVGTLGKVKLVGLKPRSPKFPILVLRISDGKKFKLSERQFADRKA